MDQLQPIALTAIGYAETAWDIAKGWLLSPAAWSQFGLLEGAFLMAVVVTRRLKPALMGLIAPASEADSVIASARRFALIFPPLLLPLLAHGFTAMGEKITRQLFDSGAVIVFGKRFFLFLAAFLMLMNIMGVNLTSLAVLGAAIGVGLGFGLQKIASNFISGVILLVEGQATVGDYVELDSGEAGCIAKMTARATVLDTCDGCWIVVANEDFITTRVVNHSDAGSAKRVPVTFSVSYDTDFNRVPDLIVAAVSNHPGVLQAPEPPDVGLAGFGDSGIDLAVEFWVNRLDEMPNKYSSEVRFLIWNALKGTGIEIPYPHRVVEIKGAQPQ